MSTARTFLVGRIFPAASFWLGRLAILLLLLLARTGYSQVIANVTPANITPSGFSVVWTCTSNGLPAISVFADPNGVTNLAGQVGIELYPVHSGNPALVSKYSRLAALDSLAQQMAGQGRAYARITGCQPGTAYYFKARLVDTNGQDIVVSPASGPLPGITTAVENAFVLDSEQLVLDVTGAKPGTIVLLSNTNASGKLAAVVGDGGSTNQVVFNMSDLLAVTGNTNYQPVGTQAFAASVLGVNGVGQSYNVDFTSGFGVGEENQFSLNPDPGAPVIVTPPVDVSVNLNSPASFSVAASGNGPLHYQWQFNGSNLPGATNTSYSLAKVQATNVGPYQVVVSNLAGFVIGGPANLAINTKPVIVTQPVDIAGNLGSNVTFSVGVTGTAPFSYQWKLNGTNLGGATKSGYVVLVDPSTVGSYSVTITNVAGSVASGKAKLTINQGPMITKALLDHTNLVGTAYTFAVTATGATPLGYQWKLNGATLPGATTASLALSNLVTANAGTYSVTVSNVAGLAVSSALLTVALDVVPPTVAIINPLANTNLTLNSFLAEGTALDNAQLTNVSYSLNGGPYQTATTTNQWKNWSAILDGQLIPGTNSLSVQARDFSGNTSVAGTKTTRNFFFAVPSLLTVVTNGSGTVSTNLDQQMLYIGRNYQVTALPDPGFVFTNWFVGAVINPNSALTFTMQSNLVLTVNFVPTPFVADIVGTYSGLFFESNGVAFPSSGLLSIAVDAKGLFNGAAYVAGSKLTIANGLFAPSGKAQFVLSRASAHLPNLNVSLQIDMTGMSDSMTGMVSSADGAWNAPFWAAHAVFGPGNPASFAGKYTFAIPGNSDPADGPVGNGYGSITVSTNGTVALTGNLGDGTKQAQALTSVSITPQGMWPLYEPLYTGHGALIGWVNLTNTPGVITNLTGDLVWTKEANATNVFYPGGFTNGVQLVGSGYVPPIAGSRALGAPVTSVVLAGADLPAASTNGVTLTLQNTLLISAPNPYNLKLTLVPSTGLFSGSFINPTTGVTNLLNGAVLQNQNLGAGEFLSTNTIGAVLIQ